MLPFLIIAILVLTLQLAIFWYVRKERRKYQEKNVLFKYDINNRADIFRLIQDQTIPEEDRKKLESIYNADN